MDSATIFQIQSTLILLLMYFGVYKKYNRVLHRKIMLTAIVWDVLLILQIEFTRQAINKASKIDVNPTILNVHVAMALTCVLIYFALIHSGLKLFKNDRSFISRHKFLAYAVLVLRTLVYITSYFVKEN